LVGLRDPAGSPSAFRGRAAGHERFDADDCGLDFIAYNTIFTTGSGFSA